MAVDLFGKSSSILSRKCSYPVQVSNPRQLSEPHLTQAFRVGQMPNPTSIAHPEFLYVKN
jgi:hypothetical protein